MQWRSNVGRKGQILGGGKKFPKKGKNGQKLTKIDKNEEENNEKSTKINRKNHQKNIEKF